MAHFKPTLYLVAALTLVFSSCKKNEDEVEVEPEFSVTEFGSNDETARAEYDNAVNDIFTSLSGTGIHTGRTDGSAGVILPCGVKEIDSSNGSYKFIYDSTLNCGYKVLSGSITASLVSQQHWWDVGAQIQLVFNNYSIWFKTNNQVLSFDGPLTITNLDGGLIAGVLAGKVITHVISGTINITFDINDTRSWTISKKRIYESTNGTFAGITITLKADGNVAESGTAKDGTPFITTIPDPMVWINCSPQGSPKGPYIAVKGKLLYTVGSNSMSAEPGYTYQKKHIKNAGDCSSEGYKLTYMILGQQKTTFQYY